MGKHREKHGMLASAVAGGAGAPCGQHKQGKLRQGRKGLLVRSCADQGLGDRRGSRSGSQGQMEVKALWGAPRLVLQVTNT